MGSCSAPGEPINQYALVTYLPDELGAYLDQARRDLVPACQARSHLSILPPRSLALPASQAEAEIKYVSHISQPFVVKVGQVAVFPLTGVIYLELEAGQNEITKLHATLNAGAFSFQEPYPFHPHITLAQNFDLSTSAERMEYARRQWATYKGRREFLLDRLVFVQNTNQNCWMDLRAFELRGLPLSAPLEPVFSASQTF